MKIAVIGSGSWGTAMAILLAKKDYDIYLWAWQQEETDRLNLHRENREFLPGISLPQNIVCSHDMEFCVKDADLIITAVPSIATRSTAKQLGAVVAEGQKILNISKGLEEETLLRLSQVYKSEIPQAIVSVMSGPSHAEEVSKGLPTTNVVASDKLETSEWIQEVIMNEVFRIYTSDDITGVELGGALKNVIAIAAGACDGMGLGDNTKAMLITRGLAEMQRLGVALGADERTFSGLAGIGDLVVTCTSRHSRNNRFGNLVGKGVSCQEALEQVGTGEGYYATLMAYELSLKTGVELPIISECYGILYEGKPVANVVNNLMTRPKHAEIL